MDPIPEKEWCTCTPKTTVEDAASGKEMVYPPKMGEGKAGTEEMGGGNEEGQQALA